MRHIQSTEQGEEIPTPHKMNFFRLMQEVTKSVHYSAVASISKAQAEQAKNCDLKHKGTVLSVGDRVMQFNA